jgi:hypothetical protein
MRVKYFGEFIKESSDSDYLKWKRNNVTIRGMSETADENGNGSGAMLGLGLYTAFLSNRALAKQYGKVHFVVGGIPSNPIVFNTLNEWEIWLQKLRINYCIKNNLEVRQSEFTANTTIEKEVMALGYNGIIIKGREMVHFTPEDVRYFENEDQLKNYYYSLHI